MKMNFLKKTLLASVCAFAMVGCGNDKPQDGQAASGDMKNLAITAIVEHPALDEVRIGALEQLSEEGYKEGENLTVNFQSAQGNMATAGQIAKDFVSKNPDVVLAISTPSAQALTGATADLPIVFSAVTDPVEAKLVDKLEGGGKNVTGASDVLPYEPQIELIKELVPNAKRVGFVYNSSEVNSAVVLKALKEKLAPLGMEVVEAAVNKSSEVGQAANGLVGKVDVFYTSTDNLVLSAYESMYQVAKEAKIPLIASNDDAVARGAIAALGVNYTQLGKESGKLIARILKGEKPGDIAVFIPQTFDLHVSKKHAAEQGVELPQSVLDRAVKIHD